MADKSFGVKQLNLIGPSGTPTITSPNNLNVNAVTVAISTDVSIGGQVTSNVIVGTGKSVGIGSTQPQANLTVNGTIQTRQINVTGVSTFAGIATITGTTFTNQLSVSGVSTFNNATTVKGDFTVSQTPSGDPTFKLETTPGNQTNAGGFTLIPSGFTFGLDPNNSGHTFRWNVDTSNTGYGYALKGYGGFKLKLQNQQTFGGNPITDLVTIVDDGSTTIAGNIRVAGISTFVGNTFVGSAITMYASTGIVSATSFSGSNTLKSRTIVSGATTSIENNGIGNTNITGFKSYSLMKVGLSTAAWLRLYTDSVSRSADASRPIGVDPTPGSGVIAEVITTGISTTQIITPFVIGGNLDEPASTTIYAAITNLSGSTQAITANLTILQLEV